MEHPFTCTVSGPTKSGKTTFVKQLIENRERIINTKIEKIYWFYSEEQPLYYKMKNVIFNKGLPDFNILKEKGHVARLIVLDDLMHESRGNHEIIQLFTRGCHHWNISVIQIVQNLFYDGLRTSRINSDYIVLFKNPADQLQSHILSRHLYPSNPKYFLEAYVDATSKPHGYLFIDLTQNADDLHRLKTDILGKHPTVYVPKTINMHNDLFENYKNGSSKTKTKH